MLKIYEPSIASQTILKRKPLDEIILSEKMAHQITALFGEALSPDQVVKRILADVKARGDIALLDWSAKLDGHRPETLRVPEDELQKALTNLPINQRGALELSADRICRFHQCQNISSWTTQDLGGTLGQLIRPIHRVGLYIPAGTAPLPSSVLMSAIPAQVAGVSEIALTTPPERATGKVSPIVLAAAALIGLTEVYSIGGAQAIAALAYGSETIKPVDKIFGPGNLFVTLAKRHVFGIVGIDTLAGPTETLIIADENANPQWIAADLLAQAEHDPLASAILLTPSSTLAKSVQQELSLQLPNLSRSEIITDSFQQRGGIVLTQNLDQAIDLANQYGAEHLCLAVTEAWSWSQKVNCAGGVFLGEHSFEVLGDYVAGPSHVMPTGGSARYASPLNVLDFVHIISLIALDPKTANQISAVAATIARCEKLDGHANAAEKRL